MADVQRPQGRPTIDYTARDYDSILAAMRSLIPEKLLEWTDYESDADFGNVLLQLFAHMGDVLSYYQDRIANESFLTTARTRRSVISHLRLIGYELATAAPAAATLTVTVPENQTGTVAINRGDAFATKSERDAPSIRFEYNGPRQEIHLRDHEPGPDGLRRFDLPVEEGRLISDELLGVSDGSANQRFRLHHSPFILRSRAVEGQASPEIEVVTHLQGEPTSWVLRETLAFSQSTPGTQDVQRDFVVEIDEDDQTTVIFGDGLLGAIPDETAEVRATYRIGGGASGNVGADRIQTIVGAPDLALVGAKVTNSAPAVGGSERETIERAVTHAPAVFRSMKRAVTAADYQALALNFPGVGKVRALASNWNTVSLHVAPAAGGQVSDALHAGLLAYFEDKRPLSTRIDVQPAHYAELHVSAELRLLPYYSRAEVERRVRSVAGAVLAFENVGFGESIYLSRFYEVIAEIEGVRGVNVFEFRRADPEAEPNETLREVDPTGVITVDEDEIPRPPDAPAYAGGIHVEVIEGGF